MVRRLAATPDLTHRKSLVEVVGIGEITGGAAAEQEAGGGEDPGAWVRELKALGAHVRSRVSEYNECGFLEGGDYKYVEEILERTARDEVARYGHDGHAGNLCKRELVSCHALIGFLELISIGV